MVQFLENLFQTTRPRQTLKNLSLVAPLIFSGNLFIKEKFLEACNVGDSPIFLFRDKEIEGLGFIDKMLGTSVLTQAMGEEFICVHETKKELKAGDWVLIATDGVTDILTEEEILKIVEKFEDVKKVCEKIIEEAEKKISFYNDDKTLIMIKVSEWVLT